MLAIRMQRTGRKGHANFRVVVQDSRQTPTSGKYVALLGSYDPHTKTAAIKKEEAEFYLKHGAQPSDRVVRLLKSEGVKLPTWVSGGEEKKKTIRNPEKLRRNRPAEAAEPQKNEEPVAIDDAPTPETETVEAKPADEVAPKATEASELADSEDEKTTEVAPDTEENTAPTASKESPAGDSNTPGDEEKVAEKPDETKQA